MKIPHQIRIVLAVILLTGLLPVVGTQTGCKNHAPSTIAYQTFDAVGSGVDKVTKLASAALKRGDLTKAQADQFGKAHDKFIAAYNTAIDLAATATDNGLSLPAPQSVIDLATDVLNLATAFNIH